MRTSAGVFTFTYPSGKSEEAIGSSNDRQSRKLTPGMTLHVTMGIPGSTMYVVTAGGVTLTPGTGIIDNNGNTISENTFPFTDTLGTTALNTSSTSTTTTYTYSGPSGSQNIVFTYVPRSVQTAFGCTALANTAPRRTIFWTMSHCRMEAHIHLHTRRRLGTPAKSPGELHR